jgi:transcriptional regulator with XRE-family HTH domain
MTKATHISADAVRFGRVIQRLRLERGWSIAELARRSGFNKNYLSLLEKGKNTPSLNMLFELADIFHVEASDMLREVEQGRKEARARRASAMLAAAGLTPTSSTPA